MRRTLTAVLVAGGTTVLLASPAAAQPVSEPASCQGYLASWANPNEAFIIQTIVMPTADDLGITPGQLLVGLAQTHAGGLEPCIP